MIAASAATTAFGEHCRTRLPRLALLVLLASLAAGCASLRDAPPGSSSAAPEGTLRDGTPAFHPDLATIPDAIPRSDPITNAGNKSPYTVLGTTYRVVPVPPGYRERGFASWYGTKFHGRNTSNGEPYDVYAMTAAHKTLPIPCYVRVTNVENGRSVVVRVNDRGPFHEGRVLDLSYAAAYRLGYADKGTALIELELLDPMAPEWVARRGETVPGTKVATAAPSSSSTASTTPLASARTYVQAGAFRSQDSARGLQQTLQSLVDHAVVVQRSSDAENPWYRVRIGPLESTEALRDAQRRLAAARIVGAQVITE